MRKTLALTMLVALPLLAARAEEKEKPKPADLPVKAKLVAKTAAYPLDLGGQTAADFAKALKEGEKGGKLPPPPAVDLTLELTNTSDKDVTIWIKGDATMVTLDLKGPGAVTVAPLRAFTREFRVPMPLKLEPGKSTTLPIASLSGGFRGASQLSYWTEPGEYTLGATFTTGMSPAPKGSMDAGEGFGKVAIVAEPIKIKVGAK